MLKLDKIVPHLWFENEAKEAAEFYLSIFENSKILLSTVIRGTPSGNSEFIILSLEGRQFMFISAGKSGFSFNGTVSFSICCSSIEEVEYYYNKLAVKEIMKLDSYHFSEKYAWVVDKYGVHWQMVYLKDVQIKDKIIPSVLFSGSNTGKAKEALQYYKDIFKVETEPLIILYGDREPERADMVSYSEINLLGKSFSLMDTCPKLDIEFNESISFLINCDTQEEIDYYWDKLSAIEQECGWVKDKFNFSWQIYPVLMDHIYSKGTDEQIERVIQAIMKMKKFIIADVEKAFNGE